ncbi:hypothetical protein ES703_77782 [subsurface metagenome]
MAKEKSMEDEFGLYRRVAKLASEVLKKEKNSEMIVAANMDFYSGFVYKMLNIPVDLYTPIFAIARIAGWSAHRIEELIFGGKIIRPAYRNVFRPREYIPMERR